MYVSGLKAHLRSKFRPEKDKQTPPADGAVIKGSNVLNPSGTSDYVPSSGSDDVNSSIEDLSVDYIMDGGSPVVGRKMHGTGGPSGDATSPVTRREVQV